ncbi:fasciclin domain-containing protein [Nocardia amamiensis]|uniref:Fasciclin domain-containing protein n=1 Tax=Nocardia amamiensis TaxID=404578 RepID=A0ABS0CXP6_9NOCA|nr:fasciclin domain-containing protein [Nocardia amamiensis]MBF6301374.1 fasciclin domain-containing protein [Nocardia amamiensis]
MLIRKCSIVIPAILSMALVGAGCGDGSSDSGDPMPMTTVGTPMTSASEMTKPAAAPVGPGCSSYAAQVPSGPGSLEEMAREPVTVAASNSPQLTTFTAAVSGKLNPQVNLVDTLDGGEFTVFAPLDSAFAAIDPATIDALKADPATLTKILTYHVVPGRTAPDAVAGTHETVEGSEVTVQRSGDELTVNDKKVVCGGVETANATVYLIDGVLIPPAG